MVATADRSNQPVFSQWKSPTDWPHTITVMVLEARRILSYYELPDDYRPPKSIWHSADKCQAFIDKAMKKEGNPNAGMLEFNEDEMN